jgi:hypothetical protein
VKFHKTLFITVPVKQPLNLIIHHIDIQINSLYKPHCIFVLLVLIYWKITDISAKLYLTSIRFRGILPLIVDNKSLIFHDNR